MAENRQHATLAEFLAMRKMGERYEEREGDGKYKREKR